MARGRPPKKLGHVDALSGDEATKARLKAILATLTGDLSVPEACARLGVSESRFHELRQMALTAMLEGLAPRPVGRPPTEPEESAEVRHLKAQRAWLEEELEIARTRLEVALVNPDLLRDPISTPPEKGGSSAKKRRRKRRDKGGATTDT
jgi:transposase-like protein